MKKFGTITILVIILILLFGGCKKSNDNKAEIFDINATLEAVDYLVNLRYNGIEKMDTQYLLNYIEEETINQIKNGFNRQIEPFISVENQYIEAERAFNAYKERLTKPNNTNEIKSNNSNVTENMSDDTVGDPSSDYSIYELMMSNIYNADGERVWQGISLDEAMDKTDEEIAEFIDIREKALDSFKKKGETNRIKVEERKETESQRLADLELKESGIVITEINMDDFPTDPRIKIVNGSHVIMKDDIDIYDETLDFKIYGIDYSIDIKNLERPYKSCEGNEIYNFDRTYFAKYDNGLIKVVYTSIDKATNRLQNIELELKIKGNKILIGNIESIVTTKW